MLYSRSTKHMTLRTLSTLIALLIIVPASAGALPAFFDDVDALMTKYVADGKVDYAGIKTAGATDLLVEHIGSMALSGASAAQKKAFYINAYNVLVIHSIVSAYPVGSPMDISGFFDQKKHKVAGQMLTLNELEQTKLLRVYEDARIHFVVVCAAKGCPTLASFAYRPEKLEAQLQAQTKKALNSTYFIRVQNNAVQVSKIFEWYNGDFTKNGQTVVGYINSFRDQNISPTLSVGHYEYDWALNKQ